MVSLTNPNLINNSQSGRAKIDTTTGSRSTAASTFTQPTVAGKYLGDTADSIGKLANKVADTIAIDKGSRQGELEQTLAGSSVNLGAGPTALTTFGKAKQQAQALAYKNIKEFELSKEYDKLKYDPKLQDNLQKFEKISQERKNKFLEGVSQQELPIYSSMWDNQMSLVSDNIQLNIETKSLQEGAVKTFQNKSIQENILSQMSINDPANTDDEENNRDVITQLGMQVSLVMAKQAEYEANPTVTLESKVATRKKTIQTIALELLKKDYTEADAERKQQIEQEIATRTYMFGKYSNIMDKVIPDGMSLELMNQLVNNYESLLSTNNAVLKTQRTDFDKDFTNAEKDLTSGKGYRINDQIDTGDLLNEKENDAALAGELTDSDGRDISLYGNSLSSSQNWEIYEAKMRELLFTDQQINEYKKRWDLAFDIGLATRKGYIVGLGSRRELEKAKNTEIFRRLKNKIPFERGNDLIPSLDEKSSKELYADPDRYKEFFDNYTLRIQAFDNTKEQLIKNLEKNDVKSHVTFLIKEKIVPPPYSNSPEALTEFGQKLSNVMGVPIKMVDVLPDDILTTISTDFNVQTGSEMMQAMAKHENTYGIEFTSAAYQKYANTDNSDESQATYAVYGMNMPDNQNNVAMATNMIKAYPENINALGQKRPYAEIDADGSSQHKELINELNEDFAKGGELEGIDVNQPGGKAIQGLYRVYVTGYLATNREANVNDAKKWALTQLNANYQIIDVLDNGNKTVFSKKFFQNPQQVKDFQDSMNDWFVSPTDYGFIPLPGKSLQDIRESKDNIQITFNGPVATISENNTPIGYKIIPTADTQFAIFGKMSWSPTGTDTIQMTQEDRTMKATTDVKFDYKKFEEEYVPTKGTTAITETDLLTDVGTPMDPEPKNLIDEYTELGRAFFMIDEKNQKVGYKSLQGKFFATKEEAGLGAEQIVLTNDGKDVTEQYFKVRDLPNKYRKIQALNLPKSDQMAMVALMFKAETQDLSLKDLEYLSLISDEFAPLKNEFVRQIVAQKFNNQGRLSVLSGKADKSDTGALQDMAGELISIVNRVDDNEIKALAQALTPVPTPDAP